MDSEAVNRIDAAAAEPHAVEHLWTYFHETGHIAGLPGFTGAWFERLGDPGPDDAHRLTGEARAGQLRSPPGLNPELATHSDHGVRTRIRALRVVTAP
jgi:hypothetical protein